MNSSSGERSAVVWNPSVAGSQVVRSFSGASGCSIAIHPLSLTKRFPYGVAYHMRAGKIRQGISLSQGLLGATTRKVLQQYLIRFSEIGTKAPGTRRYFLRILERNIRDMLAREGISGGLEVSSALRGFLVSDDGRAPDFLRRIFGIRSFSAASGRSSAR